MPDRGEELLSQRREKLTRLREKGIDPYPPRFRRSHTAQEAVDLYLAEEQRQGAATQTGDVSVAGRIVALRRMGKASFVDIQDGSGRIQAHLRRDLLAESYGLLDELDLGDFLGAAGGVFRTRAGEITLEARSITLLTKTLQPLPEKWHGLADVEKRYRQRYLDLISNADARRIFQIRSKLVGSLRRFMEAKGFVEVETPILVPVAAGAYARPFVTHHNALDQTLYLRIATELYLKRLIVGGMDKVFEIGRVFRNEGIDFNHNPEFTLMESYEAYADYNGVMQMVEEMVYSLATEVLGNPKLTLGEHVIDVTPPWQRVSLREATHRMAGVDIQDYPDAAGLAVKMRDLGVDVEQRDSRGRLIDKLISARVQPSFIQPTFLLDYPVEMSPLAKGKADAPGYVERFEGFIAGMEVANSFTELNDPIVQRERLLEQEAMRKQFGDEEMERLDEDFLLALEHGMPPTGGLGMGIDRLVMLFAGQHSIREVILFPQLRTK